MAAPTGHDIQAINGKCVIKIFNDDTDTQPNQRSFDFGTVDVQRYNVALTGEKIILRQKHTNEIILEISSVSEVQVPSQALMADLAANLSNIAEGTYSTNIACAAGSNQFVIAHKLGEDSGVFPTVIIRKNFGDFSIVPIDGTVVAISANTVGSTTIDMTGQAGTETYSVVITQRPELFFLNNQTSDNATVLHCEYDFAVDGGAVGAINMRRTGTNIPAKIPSNAFVYRTLYAINDDLLGVGASAKCEGTGELTDAVFVVTAVAGLGAGFYAGRIDETTPSFSNCFTTVSNQMQLVVSGAPLTAGKLQAWVFYVPYEQA